MSASDNLVLAVHIVRRPKEDSECTDASSYSYGINDEVLFSTRSPRYVETQDHPSHALQPALGPRSAQDELHLQSNDVSVSHVPPKPVERIMSRQAKIHESNVNGKSLDKGSGKPSITDSNRSSLSYDGDLALDDKGVRDHIRFTPPTSIISSQEGLRKQGIPVFNRKESSIRAPKPRYRKSPFPSFANDPSWSEKMELNPVNIPLPPSPIEDDHEAHPRPEEAQVGTCSSTPTKNDSGQTARIASSDRKSMGSPCSSLLDLYLDSSPPPSCTSTDSTFTGEKMPGYPSSSRRIYSTPYSKPDSLRSPTQKIKSWVSSKISRVSSADGKRPTSDSFQYNFLKAGNQKSHPPGYSWKAELDGHTSLTSADFGFKKQRNETPIEVSPDHTVKDKEMLHESFDTAPKETDNIRKDLADDNTKSPRMKAVVGESLYTQEPSRTSHPFGGYSNGSKSFRKAAFTKVPEETKTRPTELNGKGRSLISSSPIHGYSRMPRAASNRDARPSSQSTRASSSETNELLMRESLDDIEMDNLIGYSDLARNTVDKVENGSSDVGKTPNTDVSSAKNSSVHHNAKPDRAKSLMPGTYPMDGRRDSTWSNASQAAINSEGPGEAKSGMIHSISPSPRRHSKQVAITEHRPAHERPRYPEPFFVPEVTIGTSQPGSEGEHARHSKDEATQADQFEPQRMRENVRRNVKPEIQPRTSSSVSHSLPVATTHGPKGKKLRHVDGQRDSWETESSGYVVDFPYTQNAGVELRGFDGGASWPGSHSGADRYDGPNRPWVPADAIAEHADDPVNQTRQVSGLRSDAEEKQELREFQKGHRRHHSFRGRIQASLHRANRKGVLARDWDAAEKKFTAITACASTALIGLIVGIYAGQVPAIQYAIVDENSHHAILGNVLFYLGLAITTILTWPLPLLYGRKSLTLSGMAILLVLQFPQALVVSQQRAPFVSTYRVGLLLPRFLSGLFAGLANINFWPTLLDVYGSSLQSQHPHQELINENDPRRHGGGMGIWLGIWTWCHIGSIGSGFVIGAVIIGYLNVAWGFWVVILATLVLMLLNVIAPETRPTVFRKSLAEVRKGADVSRRVGRGEVMMHLYSTGPLHWWEEVSAGIVLNFRMIKQSGFTIMAIYQGWIYGQVVMIMILLGALASKYYYLRPQYVALCVAAFPIGALVAVPFQKASIFSRARHRAQRTDSMTFEKRVTWSSHLVRRAAFMAALPLAAIAYTLTSTGPPLTVGLPSLFAAFVGFLTNLALSECYGLIMETFDTSDLQPGMTGRLRKQLSADVMRQRTNFSCYPRVTAGFSIVQTISFIIAAVATAVGGNVERARGVQTATAFVAAVLIGLTLLLIGALTRFRTVQIVPRNRLDSVALGGPGDDLPVIIGHPSGTTRRISLLELGNMTRWTEIRRRNKLLGSGRHGKHP